VLWNLISNLRSSHDILQRFVYPEDFLLLYSVKTDPNDILLVRFFTQIIFKSLFSTLFFLYPILFYVLNFAEESITSRLLLFVSFPFYVIFFNWGHQFLFLSIIHNIFKVFACCFSVSCKKCTFCCFCYAAFISVYDCIWLVRL